MRCERFTVRGIDSEKLKRLRIYSVASEQRMDEVVNKMIEEFLEKHASIDLLGFQEPKTLAS